MNDEFDFDCGMFGNSEDCMNYDCPMRHDCCEFCEDSYRQFQKWKMNNAPLVYR